MSRFGDAPRTFDAVGKFDEPMLYVCPPRVKKGVIVRGDVELDSPLIATLPVGTQMTVYRSKHTSDGKVRLKIKTPVVGWISEKSVERDVLSAADENVEFGEDGEPLAKPEKFSLKNPLAGLRCETPEDYMEKLKWSQTQDPGEVEIVMKLNPGTKKDEIDVLFNYRRLRVFVGEDCILAGLPRREQARRPRGPPQVRLPRLRPREGRHQRPLRRLQGPLRPLRGGLRCPAT